MSGSIAMSFTVRSCLSSEVRASKRSLQIFEQHLEECSMGRVRGKENCDDCTASWDYKCKANVHFHCSKHYFERLRLGTLPHGGPAHWESRAGAVKLDPVADFRKEATDSKVKMSSSIPAPIRSAVLKSTSQQQLQDRLRRAGVSVAAGVDKSTVQKAQDIIPKLREAIVNGSGESVDRLSKELLQVMPKQSAVKKVASEDELLKQIEILELLEDILTNQELQDYDALLEHCKVDAVDPESGEAQLIHQYMRQNMSGKQQVLGAEVFRVARKEEQNNPRSKNQVLLWHGSKTASFVSILRYGLRLPKHATHGWLFGPGVYFSDCTSKAASYSDQRDCLIALAEVNLGSMYPAFKCVSGPPPGHDSVWAVGEQWPVPATFVSGSSEHAPLQGCDVPMGRISPVKFVSGRPCRPVNEFIVYETSRVRLRYLIRARIGNGGSKSIDSELFCDRNIKPTESYLEFMQQLRAKKVMHWEYYLERAQDGKSPGWHPYDEHLHEELEQRFADGGKNAEVKSGYQGFTYRVDFTEMKQTNLTHSNHTVRKIRRAEVFRSGCKRS